MAERYKRLYALPENLYTSGSPLLIQAGALLKDTQTGKMLVQLKLKNLYHSTLVACKVSIRAFAPSGEEIKGIENHFYLDIAAVYGQSFGEQVPIYLPDDTTRKVSVFVAEAVYEDGGVWRQEKGDWLPVPQQKMLVEHFAEAELTKQYAIEVGGNCDFVPETVGGLFLCTCGAVNLSTEKTCWNCKRNVSDLLGALDLNTLIPKMDARLKEEAQKAEEQKRRAEEKRITKMRLKKKLKQGLALAIGVAALCAGAALLTTKVIIPNKKYKDAVALEEAGNYQEAIAAFKALGDHKDSPEKILECKYAQAEADLAAGNFSAAKTGFYNLKGYSDASERINEVLYAEGEHFLETKKYEQAITRFTQLWDYKESAQRLIDAKAGIYQIADELEKEGDYIQSKKAFEKIADYSDAIQRSEQLKGKIYDLGVEKTSAGDYQTAEQYFSFLGDEYLESEDYRTYCAIKEIDFDDGQAHSLEDLPELMRSVSNDTLRKELENIPQIEMCIQLEGTWIKELQQGLGFPTTFVIQNGHIEGLGESAWINPETRKYEELYNRTLQSGSVFYYKGQYFLFKSPTIETFREDCCRIYGVSNGVLSIQWRCFDETFYETIHEYKKSS